MPTIRQKLADAAKNLSVAGVSEPRRDAALLMSLTLNRDRSFLIAHDEYELNAAELQKFDEFIARREKREPLQHIIGKQEFYGLEFFVSADVLIPRPETEQIVELAVNSLKAPENPTFLDVGTGSGCISIAICKNLPNARAVACDISENALSLARKNADRHKTFGRIEFLRSNVFANISEREFDLIVTNPPYIAANEMDGLQPEVRDHDPKSALTDGADGLTFYRKFACEAQRYLKPHGALIAEFGFGQAAAIVDIFESENWTEIDIKHDLQNIPRIIVARTKNSLLIT